MSWILLLVSLLGSLEAKTFRSLACPKYCSKDISPVCGNDGMIYKNDCERRRINCGDDTDKVTVDTILYNRNKCTLASAECDISYFCL